MRQKDTLLVIPAFNEEENLPAVLAGVRSHARGMDVLVVDDGSADGTSRIARESGARCLSLPFNLGIGGALETGYKFAYRAGYRYVVRMDGDGQHGADAIDTVLAPVKRGGADFVNGSRFLGEDSEPVTSWTRRLGIAVFSWLVSRFTGRRVTDPTSGFRAFNRKVLAAFVEEFPTDFPEVETILYLHRRGLSAIEVPVRFRPRLGGKSSIDFWKSLYYMYKVTFALLILTVREYPKGSGSLGDEP